MDTPPTEKHNSIQLGDIIKIYYEEEKDKVVYITYLSPTVLEGINLSTKNVETIPLRTSTRGDNIQDNLLSIATDESYKSIKVLRRSETPSFARQYNLYPGTPIRIVMTPEEQEITLEGMITELQEDTIEIQTYLIKPETVSLPNPLYLNFNYRGIPKELNVKSIEVLSTTSTIQPQVLTTYQERLQTIQERLQNVKIDMDDLIQGKDVIVSQRVELPEEQKRYSLNNQIDDLVTDIISKEPDIRKHKVQHLVNKYKQLRTDFSIFDKNHNIKEPKLINSSFKPLKQLYKNFNKPLFWIQPAIYAPQHFYTNLNKEDEKQSDFILSPLAPLFTTYKENINEYLKYRPNEDKQETYTYYYKVINELFNQRYYDYRTITDFIPPSEELFTITNLSIPINAILNNIPTLSSSIYNGTQQLYQTRRLQPPVYSIEMKVEDTELKKRDLVIYHREVYPEDIFHITSFVCLPQLQSYSKLFLHSTNILEKSYINSSRPYRQIKDYLSNSSLTVIDTINDIIDPLSTYYIYPKSGETYDEFLERICPTIKDTIHNLPEETSSTITSLLKFVHILELYAVHHDYITFKSYEQITLKIQENIHRIIKLFNNQDRQLQYILKLKKITNKYEPIIRQLMNHSTEKMYKITNEILDENVLRSIIEQDYGEVLFTELSLKTPELLLPDEVQQQMQEIVMKLEEYQPIDDTCSLNKLQHIVKLYYTKEELEADQNKVIYVEPRFDKTDYSLIEPYIEKQNEMLEEDFILFLMSELNINEDEAKTLMNGRKEVRENDYAILILNDSGDVNEPIKKQTYRRGENNRWIEDNTIEPSVIEQLQCEENTYCSYENIKQQCLSIEQKRKNKFKNMIEQSILQFRQNIDMTTEQYIQTIEEYYKKSKSRLQLLQSLLKKNTEYYTKEHYKYGNVSNDDIIEHSPHISVRDTILGDDDMERRMKNIELFIETYTRPANEMLDENIYWLYCNDTSTKLLPTFYKRLIEGYKQDNYDITVARICKERGQLSDDNDRWVDKHSGFTIQNIDYSDEEGYDETGFRLINREILQADAAELFQELLEREQKLLSSKKQYAFKTEEEGEIAHITQFIGGMMGLNVFITQDTLLFVVQHTLKQLRKLISKENYELRSSKSGKKSIDYETYYKRMKLFFTCLFLFVYLYTHIPNIYGARSIKGQKGVLNNIDGGLIYISYILDSIRKDTGQGVSIWSSLLRTNQKSLYRNLKNVMDNIILKQKEIKERIQTKEKYQHTLLQKYPKKEDETSEQYEMRLKHIEYYDDTGQDIIPEHLRIQSWTSFLPPLIKHYTKEVYEKTINNNIIRKKLLKSPTIIQDQLYILSIQLWNTLLEYTHNNTEPILKTRDGNISFLENVCCSDTNIQSILNKVTDDDFKGINELMKKQYTYSRYNEVLLYGTVFGTMMMILLKPSNEVLTKPFEYTNEFIKIVMIRYSETSIVNYILKEQPELLKKINEIRRIGFKRTDTIQDKIEKIRMIEFTRDDLRILIDRIGGYTLRNIYQFKIPEDAYSIQYLNNNYNDNNLIEFIPEIPKNLLNSRKETNKFTDMLRNYQLVFQNRITEFLKNNKARIINLESRNYKFNTVLQFIEQKWTQLIPVLHEYYSMTDSTSLQVTLLLRQWLYLFGIILPSMNISNTIEDEEDIGKSYLKYWKHKYKLSTTHIMNLDTILKEFHSLLYSNRWLNDKDKVNDDKTSVREYYFKNVYTKCNKVIEFVTRVQSMITTVTYSTQEYHNLEDTLTGVYDEDIENKLKINKSNKFFNGYTTIVMYQYALSYILYQYISSINKLKEQLTIEKDLNVETIGTGGEEYSNYTDLVMVKENTYIEYTGDLLCRILHYMNMMKTKGTMNQTQIKQSLLRIREKEKNEITEMLGILTDEEREAENLKKEFKLGEKWSKGLGKTFREYDKDVYEMEYNELMERRIRDLQSETTTSREVSDMNVDIYSEFDREAIERGIEIEREELSMAYMHNDDDYGEGMDGDEQYY
mgnify:FL=1